MKRMGLVVGVVCVAGVMQAMAADSLKVSVTAANPPNGSWGTEFEVVMWIENAARTFQRTFGLWGGEINTNDLPVWNSKNGGAKTVDGTTGATLSATTTLRAAWNLKGSTGSAVDNGTYLFNIEISNRHNTPHFIQGSIAIDGSGETKTTIDSTNGSGSSYLTNLSVQYVAAGSAVARAPVIKQQPNPLSFSVPAGFSGTMTLRLLAPNGRQLWQKNYQSSTGSLNIAPRDIILAEKFSGIGILEATFGTQKVVHQYVMTK